jgi:hypothetical protein
MQYGLTWEQEAINNLIEKAICEADKKGAKVVSLGLLNLVYHLINIKSMQVKAKYLLRTGLWPDGEGAWTRSSRQGFKPPSPHRPPKKAVTKKKPFL